MTLLPQAYREYARVERRGQWRKWIGLAVRWLLYAIVIISLLILLAKVYSNT